MTISAFPEDIISMLHEHDFGILATSGREYPHTSLVTIIISHDSHYLFFPTLRETRKYENLLHDASVSVLLDNRSTTGKNFDRLYALSVLGKAYEASGNERSLYKDQFLMRHPHLSDFLSQPQTALVQVAITKLILVEGFQKMREFDCQM